MDSVEDNQTQDLSVPNVNLNNQDQDIPSFNANDNTQTLPHCNANGNVQQIEGSIENSQGEKSNNGVSTDTTSCGKIFIGGLSRDTTPASFSDYFSKYGEITDSIVMRDRFTGQSRGFGFVTYRDPSVVEKLFQDKHFLDGRTVEIKPIIPRGNTTGPKTNKIFVGGLPTSISDGEFKQCFAKFGKILQHWIMKDRSTGRSRGFGFITFESEQTVEEIISEGRMFELGGKQVEVKKAEPRKPLHSGSPVLGVYTGPSYFAVGGDCSGLGGPGYGSNWGVYNGYQCNYDNSTGAVYGGGYGVNYGEQNSHSYGGQSGFYTNGLVGGYDSAGNSYGTGNFESGADGSYGNGYGTGSFESGANGSYGNGGAVRVAYGHGSNGRYHPYGR